MWDFLEKKICNIRIQNDRYLEYNDALKYIWI